MTSERTNTENGNCDELRSALERLKAETVPTAASSHPEDTNSLVPDPPKIDDTGAAVGVEIRRLEQALRDAGCD